MSVYEPEDFNKMMDLDEMERSKSEARAKEKRLIEKQRQEIIELEASFGMSQNE
jgi:hypothetical protein